MDPRLSYRESAVRGASPVGLVILLYEQVLEDLRRAQTALDQGDIETRTREVNHAILVIGQLQAALDMKQGGEVARNLERFYEVVRAGLVEAQAHGSAEALRQHISHLMGVREAWVEVERVNSAPTDGPNDTSRPEQAAATYTSSEWNA